MDGKKIITCIGLGIWTVFTIWLGAFLNAKYAEVKQLMIPATVVDRKGNKLHLEEPVAHPGYYEYPIILYDKSNNYRRIDKYGFAREINFHFEGE